MYAALLGEARYFQIERLVQWLEEKRYLQAVKIERTVYQVEGIGRLDLEHRAAAANEEFECYAFATTRKVYVCPRGIEVHRGHPEACGKMCEKVRGMADLEYEDEEIWRTMVVSKRVVLNQEACYDA